MLKIDLNYVKNLPSFIKLEILKEEFLEAYKVEEDLENKNVLHNKTQKYDYTMIEESTETIVLSYQLRKKYDRLSMLFSYLALVEEDKISLYRWCKEIRRKLGLKDNLFNIFEPFIDDNKYEKINEEINKRKVL